jgi:hypothetical protein
MRAWHKRLPFGTPRLSEKLTVGPEPHKQQKRSGPLIDEEQVGLKMAFAKTSESSA